MQGRVKESWGGKIIGLYDIIVHPHRYFWSEIGLIVVSSYSSFLSPLSLSFSLSSSSENKGGGDKQRMFSLTRSSHSEEVGSEQPQPGRGVSYLYTPKII